MKRREEGTLVDEVEYQRFSEGCAASDLFL